MTVEEKLGEYICKMVSVWNEDGEREVLLPQNKYLNFDEAVSICTEALRMQREECAEIYMPKRLYLKYKPINPLDVLITKRDEIENTPQPKFKE